VEKKKKKKKRGERDDQRRGTHMHTGQRRWLRGCGERASIQREGKTNGQKGKKRGGKGQPLKFLSDKKGQKGGTEMEGMKKGARGRSGGGHCHAEKKKRC